LDLKALHELYQYLQSVFDLLDAVNVPHHADTPKVPWLSRLSCGCICQDYAQDAGGLLRHGVKGGSPVGLLHHQRYRLTGEEWSAGYRQQMDHAWHYLAGFHQGMIKYIV